MTAIAAHVTANFDKLLNRSAGIRALNLPSQSVRSDTQHTRWLQLVFSQAELRSMFNRALKVLDTFTPEDPEWDVLTELMDPLWRALTEENRP